MKKNFTFVLLLLAMMISRGQSSAVTPYMFGLNEAKNGVERYWVLYNTHVAAVQRGVEVNYDGIGQLNIEIPKDAQSIPLTPQTDFKHLVLNVTNKSKSFYLFQLTQSTKKISITKEMIDNGDFTSVKELKSGHRIVILQDDNLWVDKRQGHNYGHTRKDILYLENGIAENSTIMPYNTEDTKPTVHYCSVSTDLKLITGIRINRQAGDTYKTYCFDVKNQFNVELRDIIISTPKSTLVADGAIRINDCANVRINRVQIIGTYSRIDYYGYGILMDNVWNTTIKHLTARANWGIFGSNNISEILLDSCDINRYDIHCYGRDITLKHCEFTNLYNQFSSVYGYILFEKCVFDNHVPVLLESSYNAFTPFELIFKDCIFNINPYHNYIVDARNLNNITNSRKELKIKCLPNISFYKTQINVLQSSPKLQAMKLYMIHFNSVDFHGSVGYINKVYIQNLKVNGGKIQLKTCNKDFPHDYKIEFPYYNQIIGK